MVDADEYILIMKMKDINGYNEIKKKKKKILIKINMESIVKNVMDI